MGSLEIGNIPPDCADFIHWVNRIFTTVLDLNKSLPVHKFWETKAMRLTVEAHVNVSRIAQKYVKQRVQEIDDHSKQLVEGSEEAPPKVDFLTYLMHSGALTLEEVIANIIDQMIAGVETVRSNKIQCILLASFPGHMEKLFFLFSVWSGNEASILHTQIYGLLRSIYYIACCAISSTPSL